MLFTVKPDAETSSEDGHHTRQAMVACSGGFGGGDGFVQSMASLVIFAWCCFHAEDGFC